MSRSFTEGHRLGGRLSARVSISRKVRSGSHLTFDPGSFPARFSETRESWGFAGTIAGKPAPRRSFATRVWSGPLFTRAMASSGKPDLSFFHVFRPLQICSTQELPDPCRAIGSQKVFLQGLRHSRVCGLICPCQVPARGATHGHCSTTHSRHSAWIRTEAEMSIAVVDHRLVPL
jgi:hypothetical protein